jgi:hypothetical protein
MLGGTAFAAWQQYQEHSQHFTVRREDNPANWAAIDSAIHLLKSGDIVLRAGADATSMMLMQMNQRDKSYSHCGIVLIEHGYPFVYHCIGGEDNPDERLRRDSASLFFSPFNNERLGIARLPLNSRQLDSLSGIVGRYFKARMPFDMDFDLSTNDRFYCSEFVCKSIEECVGDTAYFSRSHAMNKDYIGIDNLTDPRRAELICDVRYRL